MLYKTITLNLLREQSTLYEDLRIGRTLEATLNRLAANLRDRHRELLSRVPPGDSAAESAALETALAELQARLAAGSIDSAA